MNIPEEVSIFIPTPIEATPWLSRGGRAHICGMGLACDGCLENYLRHERPRLAILAGTAGAYAGSGLGVGDCVIVDREFDCLGNEVSVEVPSEIAKLFPVVGSMTVDRVGAEPHVGALVENMEGIHFMRICNRLGIRCVELRVISNMVAAPRGEWRIPESSALLPEALEQIISLTRK